MHRLRIRLLIAGLLFAAAGILATGCGSEKQKEADSTPGKRSVFVATFSAETGQIQEVVNTVGTVEAVETVGIRPEIDGIVEKIHFRQDAQVSTGKLLFALESDEIRRRLQRVQAQLDGAEAEAERARRFYKRRRELFSRNVISAETRDMALADDIVKEISNALQEALDALKEERRQRLAPMKQRVAKYDARFWAESFLDSLNRLPREAPEAVETRPLSADALYPFLAGRNAALFLDYDGTLAELRKRPADAVPAGEVKEILSRLDRQKDLDMYLVGGRTREDMDRWFSKYRFHLVAEHGYCFKEKNADDWVVLTPETDLSWKGQIIDALELYAEMTPGSFLEEKTASVVWHYAGADPEFGAWKAHQLVSSLQEMLSNLPVQIHHGKKIVEIASVHANKGVAVSLFMTQRRYEAALCAGDDETDEAMFRLSDERILSAKIDSGETGAMFRSPSPKAFRTFLHQLLTSYSTEG